MDRPAPLWPAGGSTLADFLDGLAAEHGPRVALVQGERELTFDGLRAATGGFAGELAEWGVRRGDVVALWLPNVLEYVVAQFALAALGAAALGAAALGMNTRYGEHEVSHLFERGAPVGVLVPDRFLGLDFVGTLPATGPWVRVIGGAHQTATRPLPHTGRPDDPVAYFTTSGSTGAPKLPGHTQRAVVEHAHNVARAFDMRPGDAVHLALPLGGVFGFSTAFGMLAAGGTSVLEPVFDPDRMAHGELTAMAGSISDSARRNSVQYSTSWPMPTATNFHPGFCGQALHQKP